jgi:ubiquinone/menaquinone biosynthesis C-methylase UbiE
MSGNLGRQLNASGFAEMRYNKAMRKVWPWPAMLLEKAAHWIKALPGDIWLDAACGEGYLGPIIKEPKKLHGLDIDLNFLKQASGRPYLSLTQASVTNLPFRESSLDGIVSIETLEHVEQMSSALKEFAKCIKPGGYLLVSMPAVTLRSRWNMHRTGHPDYCCEKEHVRELSAIPIQGFKNRFQTFQWLENEFTKAGFTMKRRSGVGFLFPMCRGWCSFLEHAMNLLYREKINKLFARLPLFRNFAYYRLYLARLARPGCSSEWSFRRDE